MSRSVDLREAAVAYYEGGHTLIETGKVFRVGKTTVSNWVKKKRETGDVHNKPLNRGFIVNAKSKSTKKSKENEV